jgi:hypothetical protein
MLPSFFRPRPASHPVAGGFLLTRRPVVITRTGRDIDPFARDLDGRDLGHWLAASRNAHAVAGSGARSTSLLKCALASTRFTFRIASFLTI